MGSRKSNWGWSRRSCRQILPSRARCRKGRPLDPNKLEGMERFRCTRSVRLGVPLFHRPTSFGGEWRKCRCRGSGKESRILPFSGQRDGIWGIRAIGSIRRPPPNALPCFRVAFRAWPEIEKASWKPNSARGSMGKAHAFLPGACYGLIRRPISCLSFLFRGKCPRFAAGSNGETSQERKAGWSTNPR